MRFTFAPQSIDKLTSKELLPVSYLNRTLTLLGKDKLRSLEKLNDMKTNSTQSVIKMDKEDLKKLTTEVKETLATDVECNEERQPVFGVADLWNIQRSTRFRIQRRPL